MKPNDRERLGLIDLTLRDLKGNSIGSWQMELAVSPSEIAERLRLGDLTLKLQGSFMTLCASLKSESETTEENLSAPSTETPSNDSKSTSSLNRLYHIFWLCEILERRSALLRQRLTTTEGSGPLTISLV